MVRIYFAMLLASLTVLTEPVFAQDTPPEPLQLGESGQAYVEALRFRGVQTGVAYFDPTQPPPPFETRQRVRPDRDRNSAPERTVTNDMLSIIAVILLAGLAILIFRSSGSLSVSFKQQ